MTWGQSISKGSPFAVRRYTTARRNGLCSQRDTYGVPSSRASISLRSSGTDQVTELSCGSKHYCNIASKPGHGGYRLRCTRQIHPDKNHSIIKIISTTPLHNQNQHSKSSKDIPLQSTRSLSPKSNISITAST